MADIFYSEQVVFTTKAHIFQIDPQTKKNWKPCSSESVPINIVLEPRYQYRITSSDGTKTLINSTLSGTSAFTKTSPKFGQWNDPRAGTIFGLGFGVEADLAKVRNHHTLYNSLLFIARSHTFRT